MTPRQSSCTIIFYCFCTMAVLPAGLNTAVNMQPDGCTVPFEKSYSAECKQTNLITAYWTKILMTSHFLTCYPLDLVGQAKTGNIFGTFFETIF